MSEKAPLKNQNLIEEAHKIRLQIINLAKLGKKEEALALLEKMPDTFDKDSAKREVDFYLARNSD